MQADKATEHDGGDGRDGRERSESGDSPAAQAWQLNRDGELGQWCSAKGAGESLDV